MNRLGTGIVRTLRTRRHSAPRLACAGPAQPWQCPRCVTVSRERERVSAACSTRVRVRVQRGYRCKYGNET